MAPKDLKALLLLAANPSGLYGSELVSLSKGFIGRGTVYTLLGRLVERGVVRQVEEPPTASLQMMRTRHFITADGKRALQEYLAVMELQSPAIPTLTASRSARPALASLFMIGRA
jgi:DNA-binding PadR family transcriptional regulator